jgi:hypothetical protein
MRAFGEVEELNAETQRRREAEKKIKRQKAKGKNEGAS